MQAETDFDLGGQLRTDPHVFLSDRSKEGIKPNDLVLFAPPGNGVYGYQQGIGKNPMTSAPPQEATSGSVVYFDSGVAREDFDALLRVLAVQPAYVKNPTKDYAIYVRESESPRREGYLRQARIVSKFGLRFMFGAINDAEYMTFPEQPVPIADALWTFIEHERAYWGTHFGAVKLAGLFGGDGDLAQEKLSFGFMVENEYHQVYRIWSRAWLVTK